LAKLRIRLKLNEGGEGAPLDQLADIGRQAERFLRFLAADLGMPVPKGEWLARNFLNGSVEFDSEHPAEYTPQQIASFNAAFLEIASLGADDDHQPSAPIQHRTMLQFTRIAESVAVHERVGFGLYRATDRQPYQWRPLSKRDALTIKERLAAEVTYVGATSGRIRDVIVEGTPAFYLRVRSGDLVRCVVSETLYRETLELIRDRGALVYVHGRIRARRIDRSIREIFVRRIKAAPKLTPEQYEEFFGVDPNYTGELTTEEFIEAARSNGD